LFGVGTLLWGQIITSIPTRSLPKKLEVGNEVPDLDTFQMDGSQENGELRKGQVLWLRGIARLQTQVSNSFRIISFIYSKFFVFLNRNLNLPNKNKNIPTLFIQTALFSELIFF